MLSEDCSISPSLSSARWIEKNIKDCAGRILMAFKSYPFSYLFGTYFFFHKTNLSKCHLFSTKDLLLVSFLIFSSTLSWIFSSPYVFEVPWNKHHWIHSLQLLCSVISKESISSSRSFMEFKKSCSNWQSSLMSCNPNFFVLRC